MARVKIAVGLGAVCGGCSVALLDLGEKLFLLKDLAEIVFWPLAVDFKFKDLESFGKNEIDIAIYQGAIRTDEQLHLAKVLREKAKVLIASGSCACFGGIPGLANITNRDDLLDYVYRKTASTKIKDPDMIPSERTILNGFDLTLPKVLDQAYAVHQIVDVDYFIPGCPPEPRRLEKIIEIAENYIRTGRLPPKGTVIAGKSSLCEECPREKPETISVDRIYRPHEIKADPNKCFLAQGILCLGPVTRSGCGANCINVNMPCRGCMGPTEKVTDQGAKMISAFASLLALEVEDKIDEETLEKLIGSIKDPLGTFYRYTFAVAIINKVLKGEVYAKK